MSYAMIQAKKNERKKGSSLTNDGRYLTNSVSCFSPGYLRSVLVRQEDRDLRGGGHVRTPHRHDPQRVQDENGPQQRSQPIVQ